MVQTVGGSECVKGNKCGMCSAGVQTTHIKGTSDQCGVARAIGWFGAQGYLLPQASSLTTTVPVQLTANNRPVVLPSNHPDSYTDLLGVSHSGVVRSFNTYLTAQRASGGTYSVTASLINAHPETGELLASALISAINLSGHAMSTLTAGTYVVSSLSISGQARLIIDASAGPVNLFVTGAISVAGKGISNTSQLPQNLNIVEVGSASVQVSGGSDF